MAPDDGERPERRRVLADPRPFAPPRFPREVSGVFSGFATFMSAAVVIRSTARTPIRLPGGARSQWSRVLWVTLARTWFRSLEAYSVRLAAAGLSARRAAVIHQ